MTNVASTPSTQLLDSTVHSILETMFFVEPEEPTGEGSSDDLLWTEVTFSGAYEGVLVLGLSEPSALTMASDLLGESEQCGGAGHGVARELANIICGALLSGWQTDSLFDLNAPRELACKPQGSFPLSRDYILPDGRLAIRIDIQP